ncbi:hypothetical protein [Agrobacterium larrymoorei]|uniref:Uncharacterized protein n=1 Tax=Agrobacterium larrymoorei TaxID=160699 RepID=A0A4D7E109_9HYPH|nr:hypothetical protein [Agrobacterium larrymoorei]QCJ00960.1 hypothetical protein CFBP5473_23555 [Agrobacterium larrymoorei]QYA10298.1 hypothetical protein J5285_22225 [Agrobacterium larrymoorei]
MQSPETARVGADGFMSRTALSGIGEPISTFHERGQTMKRRWHLRNFPLVAEICRVAVPKQEQVFLGACLVMLWLISAASLCGYVMLAFFVLVALARFAKHKCLLFAEKLHRRSGYRHHLISWVTTAFFLLLTVRACYIAAVIVDTRFR